MVVESAQKWLKIGLKWCFCRNGEKGRKRQKMVKKGQILAKNGDFWPFLKKFKKKFYFCPNSAPKKGRAQALKRRVDFWHFWIETI